MSEYIHCCHFNSACQHFPCWFDNLDSNFSYCCWAKVLVFPDKNFFSYCSIYWQSIVSIRDGVFLVVCHEGGITVVLFSSYFAFIRKPTSKYYLYSRFPTSKFPLKQNVSVIISFSLRALVNSYQVPLTMIWSFI